MDPELESLIAADEGARARVETAREAARARVESARDDHRRRTEAQIRKQQQAVTDEVRRIEDEAAQAIAGRRAARARYGEARRAAADTALAEAGTLYALVVRAGEAPGGER